MPETNIKECWLQPRRERYKENGNGNGLSCRFFGYRGGCSRANYEKAFDNIIHRKVSKEEREGYQRLLKSFRIIAEFGDVRQ